MRHAANCDEAFPDFHRSNVIYDEKNSYSQLYMTGEILEQLLVFGLHSTLVLLRLIKGNK